MQPIERARAALEGLSVGDAFGERFFGPGHAVMAKIEARTLAPAPWRWTDDTAMAISLVEVLEERGGVDQDHFIAKLVARWSDEPDRGYGGGAHQMLSEIAQGRDWRVASRALFRGKGSFGNGAAMRVAPLGAYFADDLPRLKAEAILSAEVTHAHEEGIAGAIAVAVATALVVNGRERGRAFLEEILAHVPAGYVHDGIAQAIALPPKATIVEAAVALGNGSGVSAPDTVPLCLWVVSREWRYEEAMWTTVSALGDRDTTCAIVGGILGDRGIPDAWRAAREALPT